MSSPLAGGNFLWDLPWPCVRSTKSRFHEAQAGNEEPGCADELVAPLGAFPHDSRQKRGSVHPVPVCAATQLNPKEKKKPTFFRCCFWGGWGKKQTGSFHPVVRD